ncbi:hypothetical protein [Novosphingobium sp.]|uniref:hypothetical protein n=1 Tax=Novosphingobium sp. TaxID=1874826 RepID=UPI002635D60C|nr:hypothetical protein [Novosphingobium sp.]
MRALSFLLAVCLGLAALRFAIAALLIAVCVLLIWGALFYARETIAFLCVAVACGMMEHHPVVTLAALAVAALTTRKE